MASAVTRTEILSLSSPDNVVPIVGRNYLVAMSFDAWFSQPIDPTRLVGSNSGSPPSRHMTSCSKRPIVRNRAWVT